MSDVVIQVENLSKRYLLSHQGESNRGLRHVLNDALSAPFRRKQKLTGAQKTTEEFWALKDVSFEIKRGEVVGIIGRNGAGKSTLLKILSRITEPTSGRIQLAGRVASLLEVGTGFHPELTGRENIFLNGAILGMSRVEIKAKFDEIVDFAEVEKFLDTPVKRYSSGMYVRLAFAVAAHLEPEILIIDEVLAVGDAAFQKKCLGKMENVAKNDGRTILFVSHNMAAVTQLCSKAIWLNLGHLKEVGPSDSIVRSYMECGLEQIAERVWKDIQTAPGDDQVRVIGARVIQDGKATGVIDINQECRIEIDLVTLKPARNLLTGINLFDSNGQCILNCVDWRESRLAAGSFRKHMTIPAQTLAEGKTSVLVRAVFYEPDVMSVILPEVLMFEAIDSDHPLAVRGHYKEPWPGAVRLRLPWSDAMPLANNSKS